MTKIKATEVTFIYEESANYFLAFFFAPFLALPLAGLALTGLVMTVVTVEVFSAVNTAITRRFLALPSTVLLSATGLLQSGVSGRRAAAERAARAGAGASA